MQFPTTDELMSDLLTLASTEPPVSRYLKASLTGRFVHPDGRTDPFSATAVTTDQAAPLAHLARKVTTELSIEIGFGTGASTMVILAARRSTGAPFHHLAFDPFGLDEGVGEVTQDYLEQEFGASFERRWERSEVGLGQVIKSRGLGQVGLIFVDGGHQFENVMTDFTLSDLLCAKGGYIVFHDACFPAIETAINYINANRPDYAIAPLPVPNMTVLQKLAPDHREWFSFKPFVVPDRTDWTIADTA